jgi:hypothetical protein
MGQGFCIPFFKSLLSGTLVFMANLNLDYRFVK